MVKYFTQIHITSTLTQLPWEAQTACRSCCDVTYRISCIWVRLYSEQTHYIGFGYTEKASNTTMTFIIQIESMRMINKSDGWLGEESLGNWVHVINEGSSLRPWGTPKNCWLTQTSYKYETESRFYIGYMQQPVNKSGEVEDPSMSKIFQLTRFSVCKICSDFYLK